MDIRKLRVNDVLYDKKGKFYIVKKIYYYYAADLEYDGKVVQQYSSFLDGLCTKEEEEYRRQQEEERRKAEECRRRQAAQRREEAKRKAAELYKQRELREKQRKEEQRRKIEAQKKELKSFLEERGIEYLIHFTSKENIESIKKRGLLSREILEKEGIGYKYNDDARYDGYDDAISLSITNPNLFLLKRFIGDKALEPVMIKIDAALLYEEIGVKRIYCVTNAATYSTKSLNGETLKHFKSLFQEELSYETAYGATRRTLTREGIAENEPTSPQAEILFFGRIDPKYFVSIEEP